MDDDVLAVFVPESAKACFQRINEASIVLVREHAEKTDPVRLPGRLRLCRKRPSCRATEQRDEVAPLYPEHGEFLPCRLASSSRPIGGRRLTLGLPHLQSAAEEPASLAQTCTVLNQGRCCPCACDQG